MHAASYVSLAMLVQERAASAGTVFEHLSLYVNQMRPSMTGLWPQVGGRNNTSYEERVALDHRNIERQSPWLDLRILLNTVGAAVVFSKPAAILTGTIKRRFE